MSDASSDLDTLSETIREQISAHPDPETGRPLGSMGQLKELQVTEDAVELTIGITTHCQPIADEVADTIRDKVTARLHLENRSE